jgi:hypothetical protein
MDPLIQRDHIDELVLDSFEVEHLARHLGGMRDRHPVEDGRHPLETSEARVVERQRYWDGPGGGWEVA